MYNTVYDPRMIPVKLTESSFSGNTYSFGILDSVTGEWALPLSSEYEMCKYLSEYCDFYLYGNFISFVDRSDYNHSVSYAYNISTNTCTKWEDRPFDQVVGYNEDELLVSSSYSNNWINNPSVYDVATGKMTTLSEGELDFYVGRMLFQNDYISGCLLSQNDKCIVLDKDLNVLNYDLSGYDIEDFYLATSELVVFETENPNGDTYILYLIKTGKIS